MTKWIGGQFLIASPYLSDGNFFRSVVYMVRHDAEGAFGVVINRPTDKTLDDAFTELLGRSPKRHDRIYVGGPVNGPLLALHDIDGLGEPAAWIDGASDEGSSGIWLTADEDHLRVVVDRPSAKAKFVAQYSGWGPSQLDQELAAGGWLVGPCDTSILFDNGENTWETVVKRLGHEILTTTVAKNLPFDPGRN